MKYVYLLLSGLVFCTHPCAAQHEFYRSNETGGKHEFLVTEGALSTDQLIGIFRSGPLSGNISFPNSLTGALMASYHHHFSRRGSAGLTIGIDHQKGDISYGDPRHGYYVPGMGEKTAGIYKRQAYTIAAEARFAYFTSPRFSFYGLAGAGYTAATVNYSFFSDLQQADHFYGPTGMVPSNPYTDRISHFNGQLTPLGIRCGNSVAFSLELGFGYKGLLCMGISGRI